MKTKRITMEITKDWLEELDIKLFEFMDLYMGNKIYVEVGAENSRSLAQNRFFHGALIPAFMRLVGYPNDVLHKEIIKQELKDYFKDIFTLQLGENRKSRVITKTLGTRDLTVEQMADFLDRSISMLERFGGHLNEYENQLRNEIK